MDAQMSQDILEAGTGFMIGLAETLKKLEEKGYTENLSARYDHFEAQSGRVQLYPDDFVVDHLIRFENTSDPDDQSVLYAISAPAHGVKGVYVESYGTYHEELSPIMLEAIKDHPH